MQHNDVAMGCYSDNSDILNCNENEKVKDLLYFPLQFNYLTQKISFP